MEDNWIPVSERMPDANKEVLMYVKYDEYPTQGYWNGSFWIGSSNVLDNMNDGFVSDAKITSQDLVTHWQPLPSPPKNIQ